MTNTPDCIPLDNSGLIPAPQMFYFRGEYFLTFEEFITASQQWHMKSLNKNDFLEIWNRIGMDVFVNIEMESSTIKTNHDLAEKSEMLIVAALEILTKEFQKGKYE